MRLAPSAGNSFCNGYIDHGSLRMRKGEKNEEDFIVTSCSLPILPPSHPHPFLKTGHWRLRTRLLQDLREHKISQKSWWIQAALNDVRFFWLLRQWMESCGITTKLNLSYGIQQFSKLSLQIAFVESLLGVKKWKKKPCFVPVWTLDWLNSHFCLDCVLTQVASLGLCWDNFSGKLKY